MRACEYSYVAEAVVLQILVIRFCTLHTCVWTSVRVGTRGVRLTLTEEMFSSIFYILLYS